MQKRLKGWQIALIVIGVIIALSIVPLMAILAVTLLNAM